MKRSELFQCALLLGGLALMVVTVAWLSGWRPNFDRSVVLGESFRTLHGYTIENGSAFDQTALEIGTCKKVVLPDDAIVRREGEGSKLRLFLKKTLAFGGHPPHSMSIRDGRKHIGCAVKAEGDTLFLATFGEWDTGHEGGVYLRVVVLVPTGIAIEERAGLSGMMSALQNRGGHALPRLTEFEEGCWNVRASPGQGWTVIPDIPDSERRAEDAEPGRPTDRPPD
jgi:hypothetical protein